MSYDEEQQRKSRVVVETPTSRREEVSYTHRERAPERSGYSTGMVAAVALTAIALTAFVLFFLMSDREDATNANTIVATTAPTPIPTAQTPIIIQQPVQQPPVIIEQPATMQPAPVIITPPAPVQPHHPTPALMMRRLNRRSTNLSGTTQSFPRSASLSPSSTAQRRLKAASQHLR